MDISGGYGDFPLAGQNDLVNGKTTPSPNIIDLFCRLLYVVIFAPLRNVYISISAISRFR